LLEAQIMAPLFYVLYHTVYIAPTKKTIDMRRLGYTRVFEADRMILFLVLLIASVFSSCDDDNDTSRCMVADGNVRVEERMMSDFTQVSGTFVGNMILVQSDESKVKVESSENIRDITSTTVVNGKLEITLTQCVKDLNVFNVYIYSPDFSEIDFTGVGDIITPDDLVLGELNVSLSGVGDIQLRGEVEVLTLSISGVGNINAFMMDAASCKVLISGTGNAEVSAREELDVTISGTGNVYYQGNPTITTNISGNGNLISAN
jgi:hypothetical protein